LPEVETVRRGLQPALEGATIERLELRRSGLRCPFSPRFAARLKGRRIAALGRRAKYLLAELDDGTVLLMHLGMSGSFRIETEGKKDAKPVADGAVYYKRGKLEAHDHVVFHLKGGTRVVYNDPRRFGCMLLIRSKDFDAHPMLAGLRLQPTRRDV